MKRTTLCTLILTTLLLSMSSGIVAGEEPETAAEKPAEVTKIRDWILRFGFVVAETDGSTSVAVDPGSVDVRLSGGGGGFVTLENAIIPVLGLEFGITTIGADMNVSTYTGAKHIGADVGIIGMSALTLGANFRFVRTRAINVYAGPLVAFNRYAEWSVHSGDGGGCWPSKHGCDDWVSLKSSSDSEITWGAKIGIDIVLTKKGKWTFGGSLTYLDASYDFDEVDGEGRGSIDFDPLMFSFGAGFRF